MVIHWQVLNCKDSALSYLCIICFDWKLILEILLIEVKLDSTIVLYSVNTKIAYYINNNYYGKHFVWCSPVFDSKKLDSLDAFSKIPPSSNPFTIYSRFREDVQGGDLHSNFIINNRFGLKNGAIHMLAQSIIDEKDFARIDTMIDGASINEFSPLLYIIPINNINGRLKTVSVDIAANPLSVEYQISDLKSVEFNAIEY